LRVVFAGTPEFAARALAALIDAGHDVVAVLAQPDRPSGRGLQVHLGPVKALALTHAIPVLQPQGLRIGGRFDADARAAIERLQATPHDVMVVAAYGLILPPTVLALPPHGCINIHASLLPRWRGAAPIQRAIEAGDVETGITIMQMDAGLDTGDVLSVRTLPIAPDDTAASLTSALADLGSRAIVDTLARLAQGPIAAKPQHAPGDTSSVTYAAKLSKAEGLLDFALPARVLADRIRAFDPWPGCSATLVGDAGMPPVTFRIWGARALTIDARPAPGDVLGMTEAGLVVATGDGALVLTALQKPGGKRLAAQHFRSDFDAPANVRFVRGQTNADYLPLK
jgi:methionyl-tRNA formyltransferase